MTAPRMLKIWRAFCWFLICVCAGAGAGDLAAGHYGLAAGMFAEAAAVTWAWRRMDAVKKGGPGPPGKPGSELQKGRSSDVTKKGRF